MNVTIDSESLVPGKDKGGILTMDGTAKTFRYLDQEEVAMQKKAGAAK